MANIVFEGTPVDVEEGEILLDSLLRQGHDVAYGCRGGSCHSCVLMVEDSSARLPFIESSQASLSAEEKRLNYFLACQCSISTEALLNHSEHQVNIGRLDTSQKTETVKILEKTRLNSSVISLRLASNLNYKPGQFITVSAMDEGTGDEGTEVSRSYSIASHSNLHNYIELHIKLIEDGHFSRLVDKHLDVGGSLKIMGPMGKCIYSADQHQAILLSAIGTGLAPIYGILLDALQHAHTGDIHIAIGAKAISDFYFIDELLAIKKAHPNVYLHFVALDLEPQGQTQIGLTVDVHKSDFHQGNVYEYVGSLLPDMKGVKVYLCGAESFVKKMRRQSFMNGASMSDIKADVFLPFSQ